MSLLRITLASAIPLLMVLFFLCFLLPDYWPIFEAIISLVEGFCFTIFYQYMITGLGGREKLLVEIDEINHERTNGSKISVRHVDIAVLSLITLRPILFIVKAALELASVGNNFPIILRSIAVVLLVYALARILSLYNRISKRLEGTNSLRKLLYLKGIIALYVIENAAITFWNGDDISRYKFTLFACCR